MREPDTERQKELLLRLSEAEPKTWDRILDEECGDDERMRSAVASLLSEHVAAPAGFLEPPDRVAQAAHAARTHGATGGGTGVEAGTSKGSGRRHHRAVPPDREAGRGWVRSRLAGASDGADRAAGRAEAREARNGHGAGDRSLRVRASRAGTHGSPGASRPSSMPEAPQPVAPTS